MLLKADVHCSQVPVCTMVYYRTTILPHYLHGYDTDFGYFILIVINYFNAPEIADSRNSVD